MGSDAARGRPVGMVLLYMTALLPCRGNLHDRIQTPLTQATRFLHKDYKLDFFAWELVEMGRRVLLVGVAVELERQGGPREAAGA